jgi:putative spermidine/putrescine transport system permease protein
VESRTARVFLRLGALVALLFLYIPLAIVVLYAFNNSIGQRWPISSFTTKYFGLAWRNPLVRDALATSIQVAVGATILALLLGSMAAFAVHRFRFFGRNAISLVLVLPIALPGIVTAMALNSAINTLGLPFGVATIIIGHATFCVVVVYNNVIARLRRSPTSLVEASMDLGADGWQTFRYVTFPVIRTAIVAGALLAFALSFDEIVVTNFVSGTQITIPKFIYNNLRQPRNRPIVNVVAVILVLLSLIPVYFAQRLAGGVELFGSSAKGGDGGGGDEEAVSGEAILAEESGPG